MNSNVLFKQRHLIQIIHSPSSFLRFGRKDHLKKHQRTHDKRKLALAKSSAGLQSLGNPLCCLPSSFGSFSNKNKLSLNRSGPLVGRSEKQSLGKTSLDVVKQPKKAETASPPKLNATKTIGSLSAIDPITGLTKGGSNGFVYDAKHHQFTGSNHNFASLTGSAISSALSSTLNSLNTISLANSKSIENQLISSSSNAASHLPLSSASPSMSLSSISNSFLGSNHPALPSMNGRSSGTVSSLIGGAANPSFGNQITSNHRPTTTISSPTSSECSFNSTLSTSINSPSLSLNALPFSNPLYFNPLMLTFIQ